MNESIPLNPVSGEYVIVPLPLLFAVPFDGTDTDVTVNVSRLASVSFARTSIRTSKFDNVVAESSFATGKMLKNVFVTTHVASSPGDTVMIPLELQLPPKDTA